MRPDGSTTGLAESFACALAGVAATARGRNFWIQMGVGIVAVALGLGFQITLAEWLAVVVCIGLVLGGECANTALEAVVDLACPQEHPLAKRAKDAAAGCVLLLSAASLIVGVMVFAPRILEGILG